MGMGLRTHFWHVRLFRDIFLNVSDGIFGQRRAPLGLNNAERKNNDGCGYLCDLLFCEKKVQ